ncbi:MAG: extracellular solute-binding protein [Planctomycetota bacterium]
MRTSLLTLAAVVAVAVGCGCGKEDGEATGEIRVLCGAGIRPAMEPIRAAFEERHNCTVRVNYAGSGTLFGNLQAGTEADLYLPGDMWYIDRAAEQDMVSSRTIVAWFVPVIAVRKGNPEGVKTLEDLAREDLDVGLGRAHACAIGNVSENLLADAGLEDKVQSDFEALTVNRLANQIKLEALDAAIVWDATAKQYPQDLQAVPLEDGPFHAVPLAMGVLGQSDQKELAEKFAQFAASETGAQAFRDNHYQVPGRRLRVGCGSSMRPPVEDLAKRFQERYGVEVLRDYGGSGTVLLQIEESKEGDVYICHDPYAYVCEDKGIARAWHTVAYIHPTLAVLKGNPKGVKGLRDLLRDDLKIGLPHREYSTRGKILWKILEKHGMAEALQSRKFYESRTHDLINQLKLETVDIAVLWDAPVEAMDQFEAIPIEEKYRVDSITSATSGRTYSLEHVKVTVVRLTLSKEPILAAQFARLCLSDEGRAILEKHCFDLPPKP